MGFDFTPKGKIFFRKEIKHEFIIFFFAWKEFQHLYFFSILLQQPDERLDIIMLFTVLDAENNTDVLRMLVGQTCTKALIFFQRTGRAIPKKIQFKHVRRFAGANSRFIV